ncbi:hypothetical protein [Kordia jejudonensis]|uniref:hypothetical protein n=1 Tax=Kordia jejudonensis TaxID=1348245 RepID=UPI000629B678|nr:hypothetical protein [Kordia jejudonensis]
MKPLSPDNTSLRITSPIIMSIFGFLFVSFLLRATVLWLVLGILSITGFFVFYIIQIYNRTENVSYDIDYIYLKNRHTTRKVSLQNIKRIEPTRSSKKVLGILYYEYRIEFINESETNDSINFWINSIDNYIAEFEKHLDCYARNVSVKHIVNPFDR